jgi:glutamyl-tRNA synthetase
MTDASVKSRFAPSPTGLIHLGNARTALFSFLFAAHHQGTFLLRIEDTDAERSKVEYDIAVQRDLHWLGLDWQEGPGADESHGPYHQSKRQAIYDTYYEKLIAAGVAYPCFCSEAQLTLMRKVQRAAGKPPRYAGTCRTLTPEDIEKKLAAGMQPTLRFRIPDNEVVSFNDLVRGEQRFNTNDIGDFIIRRANGTPPFMYCSVIDDALMQVTHVLRGEDHLTNTPRQILILQALQLTAPHYGHISLIVGPDGSPLSKRHGSRSIAQLHEQGYLAQALINYLARLGHYYEQDLFMTVAELAAAFKVENLSKSPAKFNQQQLDFWQKQAVEKLSAEQFWQWAGDDVKQSIVAKHRDLFMEAIKPNVLFPSDVAHWVQVCFSDTLAFIEEQKMLLAQVDNNYFDQALIAVDKFGEDLKAVMAHLQQQLNLKGKPLYQPIRVALTGHEHGPELAKLWLLMDKEIVKKRLQAAKS